MKCYGESQFNDKESEIVSIIEGKTKFFFDAYDDGDGKKNDCFDDGFIHINKGKFRFSFQGTESQMPRFRKLVDNALKGKRLR